MRKFFVTVFIFIYVILGFLFPYLSNRSSEASFGCTMMYCMCEGILDGDQIECNSCSSERVIFDGLIVKLVRNCGGREIITCYAEEWANQKFEIDEFSCQNDIRFFKFNLNLNRY